MTNKYVLGLIAVLAIIICAVFIFTHPHNFFLSSTPSTSPHLKVIATFYPLAEFATQVGKEYIDITTITPLGTEPHDYEPSPQDVVNIENANLFILNGAGIDTWANHIAPEITSKGIPVIDMSQTIDHIASDPHFWLDPVLAQTQVQAIATALINFDPPHTANYTANANHYIQELKSLDKKYRSGLALCHKREVIVSHDALGYLARRYNFTVIPIAGLSPHEEPSLQRLAQISRLAKEHNIKHIFLETLATPKIAQTIAQEISATTLVFNPIEGLTPEEQAQGKKYTTIMEENLTNLRIAMECQ